MTSMGILHTRTILLPEVTVNGSNGGREKRSALVAAIDPLYTAGIS